MLHIGIASWNAPECLQKSIQCIQAKTDGDWKLLVVDNASTDPRTREVIEQALPDPRITAEFRDTNTGYAGGVNGVFDWAIRENAHHVAIVDNDAYVGEQGWNTKMATIMDRHHEVAAVFPLCFSSYPIKGPNYTEIMWGLGCFFMISVARVKEIGGMDETLGHQEDPDLCQRARMAGWKLAGVPVQVQHTANATTNPAARERIDAGIVRWVDKWASFYGGKGISYHSPNVLRFADWPVNALYLEAYFQKAQQEERLEKLNQNVRQIEFEGQTYDVIEVLRHPHLYRDRLV
jgi:GT2 family glycosyltransferase